VTIYYVDVHLLEIFAKTVIFAFLLAKREVFVLLQKFSLSLEVSIV